ncbi:MAG: hypothetical protein ABW252_03105 [Polyangiales bacterium]
MLRILTVTLSGAILLGAGCADSSAGNDEKQSEPDVAAQWFAKATAEAFGCEGTRVALQTRNGTNYLTAVAGGSFGISASATKVDRFEKFKVYDVGFGRIALQAPNGRFVGWGSNQQNNGQQNGQANVADYLLSAYSPSLDQRSVFKVTRPKDSERVFIQTADGRFVNAIGGGGSLVDVATPFPGDNKQFKAICVDGPAPSDDSSADDPGGDSGWDDPADESGWDDASGDSDWGNPSDDNWR